MASRVRDLCEALQAELAKDSLLNMSDGSPSDNPRVRALPDYLINL